MTAPTRTITRALDPNRVDNIVYTERGELRCVDPFAGGQPAEKTRRLRPGLTRLEVHPLGPVRLRLVFPACFRPRVLTVLRVPVRWVVTPKSREAGRMRRRYLPPQVAAS